VSPITFFKTIIIASSALGLGCLAAGLYLEFMRGKRLLGERRSQLDKKKALGLASEK
jgi:hypothetical protein